LKTRRVPDLARQNDPVLFVRLNDRIHGTSMARKWHVGNWKAALVLGRPTHAEQVS
jgi:hypothetical protein